MRLIDADELEHMLRTDFDTLYETIFDTIRRVPTIDAAGCPYYIGNKNDRGDDSLCGLFHRDVKCLAVETRQVGQWIDDNCSVCGLYVHHGDMRNYCPQCGARMLGEIYTSENNVDNGKN